MLFISSQDLYLTPPPPPVGRFALSPPASLRLFSLSLSLSHIHTRTHARTHAHSHSTPPTHKYLPPPISPPPPPPPPRRPHLPSSAPPTLPMEAEVIRWRAARDEALAELSAGTPTNPLVERQEAHILRRELLEPHPSPPTPPPAATNGGRQLQREAIAAFAGCAALASAQRAAVPEQQLFGRAAQRAAERCAEPLEAQALLEADHRIAALRHHCQALKRDFLQPSNGPMATAPPATTEAEEDQIGMSIRAKQARRHAVAASLVATAFEADLRECDGAMNGKVERDPRRAPASDGLEYQRTTERASDGGNRDVDIRPRQARGLAEWRMRHAAAFTKLDSSPLMWREDSDELPLLGERAAAAPQLRNTSSPQSMHGGWCGAYGDTGQPGDCWPVGVTLRGPGMDGGVPRPHLDQVDEGVGAARARLAEAARMLNDSTPSVGAPHPRVAQRIASELREAQLARDRMRSEMAETRAAGTSANSHDAEDADAVLLAEMSASPEQYASGFERFQVHSPCMCTDETEDIRSRAPDGEARGGAVWRAAAEPWAGGGPSARTRPYDGMLDVASPTAQWRETAGDARSVAKMLRWQGGLGRGRCVPGGGREWAGTSEPAGVRRRGEPRGWYAGGSGLDTQLEVAARREQRHISAAARSRYGGEFAIPAPPRIHDGESHAGHTLPRAKSPSQPGGPLSARSPRCRLAAEECPPGHRAERAIGGGAREAGVWGGRRLRGGGLLKAWVHAEESETRAMDRLAEAMRALGAPPTLRPEVARLLGLHKPSRRTYYKIVAHLSTSDYGLRPGFYSMDGRIEFRLGQTTSIDGERAVGGSGEEGSGGFFVWPSVDGALSATLSPAARLFEAPRALLRVYAGGTARALPAHARFGKLVDSRRCFSLVTPVSIVARGRSLLALYERFLENAPDEKIGSIPTELEMPGDYIVDGQDWDEYY